MKLGIDYIGGVNYIPTIVRHHPEGMGAGFLCRADGWGNGIRAARALAETGLCPVMRIHGLWRDNHHFNEKFISPAVEQAKEVDKLARDYPNITIFYSPWLEPDATPEIMSLCLRRCRKVLLKRVKLVAGRTIRNRINEYHHIMWAVPGKYIFSYDGAQMRQVNHMKKVHKKAKLFYGWIPKFNGKHSLYDSTPRELRKCWPRGSDIRRVEKRLKGK